MNYIKYKGISIEIPLYYIQRNINIYTIYIYIKRNINRIRYLRFIY